MRDTGRGIERQKDDLCRSYLLVCCLLFRNGAFLFASEFGSQTGLCFYGSLCTFVENVKSPTRLCDIIIMSYAIHLLSYVPQTICVRVCVFVCLCEGAHASVCVCVCVCVHGRSLRLKSKCFGITCCRWCQTLS